MAVRNLQDEFNNFKVDIATLKNSNHSGGAGSANKYRGRSEPKCKIEVQAHHPTCWSTPYCCIHGVVGHSGLQYKTKKWIYNNEATATTRLVWITFGLPLVLCWLGYDRSKNNVTLNEINLSNLSELKIHLAATHSLTYIPSALPTQAWCKTRLGWSPHVATISRFKKSPK